jgi:carbon monoxide dehydrogenase subunit G
MSAQPFCETPSFTVISRLNCESATVKTNWKARADNRGTARKFGKAALHPASPDEG